MMRKIRITFLLMTGLMATALISFSQAVPRGAESQQLVQVMDMYENVSNLQFKLQQTISDSLHADSVYESASFTYYLSRGSTFLTGEELEMLENPRYLIYVNRADSFIICSPHLVKKGVMALPLLDSAFYRAFVAGITITDNNDTTRVLKVSFKATSLYRGCQITYNPQTLRIKQFTYYFVNRMGLYGAPVNRVLNMTITMNHYSSQAQDPALFNEARYIYKLNGGIYPQPAWQQFQFKNNYQ